ALGGDGLNGYVGGGGALMASESSMSLERSLVIGNEARGGDGTTGQTGAAGGGGLYLLRTSAQPDSISISNSIIAENLVMEGAGAIVSGGGGGGLWLQGVQVDIKHSTIARNRLGDTLVFGVGALVVNFGCQRPAVVDLAFSIVEGHSHPGGDALHVWQGNTLNLNRSLFAANSKNTNADGSPGGTPGTITGLTSCLESDSAGFVAPGAPGHDYHLLSTSPAIDQAVGSTMDEDIDGEARPQDQAPDIGADEVMLQPLQIQVSRPESGSLALSWQLAPSMLVYLDHYELRVSAEDGAAPPREGELDDPIDLGQETTFVLTGLTDGKAYVIELVAYDPADSAFADISVTTSPARVFHAFLPVVLSR
ncbi:MAG: choice-of-anchor Q domain-containing protein, partial [Anaerolineae bacterium]